MNETSIPDGPGAVGGQAGSTFDHEAMRASAMRVVSGPASTSTLSASGGLEIPGLEIHPAVALGWQRRESIPGEWDPTIRMPRQPGAMSGQFSGGDLPPCSDVATLGAATARDRAHEGGGHDATPRGWP